MAGRCVLERTRGRVDDDVANGREVRRPAAGEESVQALEQLARAGRVVRQGRERRPHLSHRGGCSEPVADDVPDRQRDPPVGQLEGVVPVAADLEHVAARLVQRRQSDAGALGEPRREQRSLQPDRDLALLGLQRSQSPLGFDPIGDVDPRRVEESHRARFVQDRMHDEIDDALAAVGDPVGQRLAEDLACQAWPAATRIRPCTSSEPRHHGVSQKGRPSTSSRV